MLRRGNRKRRRLRKETCLCTARYASSINRCSRNLSARVNGSVECGSSQVVRSFISIVIAASVRATRIVRERKTRRDVPDTPIIYIDDPESGVGGDHATAHCKGHWTLGLRRLQTVAARVVTAIVQPIDYTTQMVSIASNMRSDSPAPGCGAAPEHRSASSGRLRSRNHFMNVDAVPHSHKTSFAHSVAVAWSRCGRSQIGLSRLPTNSISRDMESA